MLKTRCPDCATRDVNPAHEPKTRNYNSYSLAIRVGQTTMVKQYFPCECIQIEKYTITTSAFRLSQTGCERLPIVVVPFPDSSQVLENNFHSRLIP